MIIAMLILPPLLLRHAVSVDITPCVIYYFMPKRAAMPLREPDAVAYRYYASACAPRLRRRAAPCYAAAAMPHTDDY